MLHQIALKRLVPYRMAGERLLRHHAWKRLMLHQLARKRLGPHLIAGERLLRHHAWKRLMLHRLARKRLVLHQITRHRSRLKQSFMLYQPVPITLGLWLRHLPGLDLCICTVGLSHLGPEGGSSNVDMHGMVCHTPRFKVHATAKNRLMMRPCPFFRKITLT